MLYFSLQLFPNNITEKIVVSQQVQPLENMLKQSVLLGKGLISLRIIYRNMNNSDL